MLRVNGIDIPGVCELSDHIFALPVGKREEAWECAWNMYMDLADSVEHGSWLHTRLYQEVYAAMGCMWTTRDFTKNY